MSDHALPAVSGTVGADVRPCLWCGRSEEWPDRKGGKMHRGPNGCVHEGCAEMYVILKALDEIKEPGANH